MSSLRVARRASTRVRVYMALGLAAVWAFADVHAQDRDLVTATQVALQTQNEGALAKLVAPLREAVADRAGASSALLLAWGRTEARVGEVDSALSAYVDLTARRDMRGRGLLEQARLLLERGMRNGPELWYLGVEAAEVSVWADYRADLLPLLSTEERRALDGLLAGEARVRWLRAFWDTRAVRDMRTGDARLSEHYKRLRFARENYRSVYAFDNTPPTIDEELDDRGRIYVRHGPADRVVKTGTVVVFDNSVARPRTVRAVEGGRQQRGTGTSEGVPAGEVWRYTLGDSSRIHLFAIVDCFRREGGGVVNAVYGCGRSRDYVALESIYDVFGPGLSRALGSGRIVERPAGLLSDLELLLLQASEIDTRYGQLLGADPYAAPVYARQEREAVREDLQRGLGSDSYAYRYLRTMRARIEPLRAGRDGTKGLMHVAYAVRAEDLTPNWAQGYLEYPIQLVMRAEDSTGAVLASFNKKKIFRADALLDKGSTLMGREAIAVPPGTHRLRVVLEHNELIGTTVPPFTITMPTAEQGQLSGGDLVLGHADYPLEWVRAPGDTVRFNPAATFSKVDGLELYHELYGLTSGATYRYTLSLLRQKGGIFGGKAKALTLSGEEKATGAVTPVRRYLDVTSLKPGRYEVRISYESDTAGNYEVSRAFELEP